MQQIENENIDKILCLGDIVCGAPKSEQVIKLKDKIICVQGNHEEYILEGMPPVMHDEKIKTRREELKRTEIEWKQLSNESIKFLKSLPKEIEYNCENKSEKELINNIIVEKEEIKDEKIFLVKVTNNNDIAVNISQVEIIFKDEKGNFIKKEYDEPVFFRDSSKRNFISLSWI